MKLHERANSLDEVLAAQISDEEVDRQNDIMAAEHFSGTFSFNGVT